MANRVTVATAATISPRRVQRRCRRSGASSRSLLLERVRIEPVADPGEDAVRRCRCLRAPRRHAVGRVPVIGYITAVGGSLLSSALSAAGAWRDRGRDFCRRRWKPGSSRVSRVEARKAAFRVAGDELLTRHRTGPPRPTVAGLGAPPLAPRTRDRRLRSRSPSDDRRRPWLRRMVIEPRLLGLPHDVRAGIEVVSIDLSEVYRQVIGAVRPDVRIVSDRFHVVPGGNAALDTVRRQRQREARNKRPEGARRTGQYLWRPERYPPQAAEALSSGHRARTPPAV